MDNPAGIILNKAKAEGLVMSRVPKDTRNEFIKFAEDQFAGDYGMLLQHLMNSYKLMSVIETFDIKLNYIISILESNNKSNEKTEDKEKVIKMLSGKNLKIKLKGGQNEQT